MTTSIKNTQNQQSLPNFITLAVAAVFMMFFLTMNFNSFSASTSKSETESYSQTSIKTSLNQTKVKHTFGE